MGLPETFVSLAFESGVGGILKTSKNYRLSSVIGDSKKTLFFMYFIVFLIKFTENQIH